MIRKTTMVVCAFLAIVTTAVWGWSLWRPIPASMPDYDSDSSFCWCWVERGTANMHYIPGAVKAWWYAEHHGGTVTVLGSRFEFDIASSTDSRGLPQQSGLIVEIPMWFPCVLFSIYPALASIAGLLRCRRRRRRNLCTGCGYNLTGNVSGRCPECGTAIGCGTRNDG
jgi:hypothetical protein